MPPKLQITKHLRLRFTLPNLLRKFLNTQTLATHWGQERIQCRLKNRRVAFLTIFEIKTKTDDLFGYLF